jgi:teichuronic acid biosynthesis glycosyltransferase TuaC
MNSSAVLFDADPSAAERELRILVVTNLYPTPADPLFGTFVGEQVAAVRETGDVAVDVLFVNGRESLVNYVRGMRELTRRVRDGGAHVVHAHYGLTGALALTQRKVPVVVTFHGSDLRYGKWRRRWEPWLSQAVGRRAAASVCVSVTGQETLRSPSEYLPCGIDLDVFAPCERAAARRMHRVPDTALALLFPGRRSVYRKRFDRFREVIAELEKRGREVRELALDGIPRETVPSLLGAADVMVLTSEFEGTPVAVMEALGAGLPVVSTPAGDVPTMLHDVDNARVASFDARVFADAVEELDGAAGRQRAPQANRYDKRRIATTLVGLYRRVAAGVDLPATVRNTSA